MTARIKLTDAINAAKKIIVARQQWNEQDGPNISWGGAVTKMISESFDMTIREVCDQTADESAEVDAQARQIMLCLDDVANAHQRWLQNASMQLPTAPPRGSDELHRTLDRLEQQMKQVDLPHPPPIKHLQAQGVSAIQIARLYGWKDEDGQPDASKVFAELEEPGSQYNAKKWVHPALRSAQAETDRAWASREPRRKMFHLEVQHVPESQPATVDTMIAEGAPVEQIMRVHGLDESEVKEMIEAAKQEKETEAATS